MASIPRVLQSADTEPTEPRLRPVVANLAAPGGPLLRTFESHSDGVMAVALSEDGKRALSGSGDRTLKLWDTEGGVFFRAFERHSSSVNAWHLSSFVFLTTLGGRHSQGVSSQ